MYLHFIVLTATTFLSDVIFKRMWFFLDVEIPVLLEPMGISVLKNAAVKMAHVLLWMVHVIALLATQVHTVISHAQQAQLG